jgi:hypothetical protein
MRVTETEQTICSRSHARKDNVMTASTTQTVTAPAPKPAAKRSTSRASKAAARAAADSKSAPKPAAAKPAPKPAPTKPVKPEVTAQAENRIALSALIAAAGDLIEHWDLKQHDGVSKAAARERISHRLSYCPAACEWDDRLAPRTVLASRTGKN